MSFKRGLRLILIAALALPLTGCGLNLWEKPPSPPPPSFSGNGYSCIGEIPDHLDNYFNDRLSNEEISAFVLCLQKSFVSFAQLTRGRDETSYSPTEIRGFIEKYFLRDRHISDGLLHEFMVIKQVLVGGSETRLTRKELYACIDFLDEIRDIALKLKPHLRVLNPNLATQQDPHDLGARLTMAADALNETVRIVSDRLSKSQITYNFSDLTDFLNEFREFVQWNQHFKKSTPVPAWIGMLKTFKQVVVTAQRPDGVGPQDWKPMLQQMARWYVTFLQYRIGVKGQSIFEGAGFQNFLFLGRQVFSLLDDSIARQRPETVISTNQILDLVQAAQGLGWIPSRIRPCSLRETLNVMFSRMFGDSSYAPDQRHSEGLTPDVLASIKVDFYRWADIQQKLNERYRAPKADKDIPTLEAAAPMNASMVTQLRALESSNWAEFIKVKDLMPRPLFPDGISRVYLVPSGEEQHYGLENGFYNLSMMNLLYSAVRLVFRGYSERGVANVGWNSGLTKAEVQKFYTDIRDLGIDLTVIDKRNNSAGSRSFIEGNLFTYSANGLHGGNDQLVVNQLSLIEAMEYAAFLYSGGTMANDLYAQLYQACLGHGVGPVPVDMNGDPKIDRACAIKNLEDGGTGHKGLFADFIPSLPALQHYLQSISDKERRAYIQKLVATAYSPYNSVPNWMESSELSTMTVVTHYGEAVLTRYDANGDGRLDEKEIRAAEPVFVGFIQDFAKNQMHLNLYESWARGAFRYILKYKSMPSMADLLYLQTFAYWNPNLNLDRGELASVFQVIISKLMEDPTKTPQAPAACQNSTNR